MKSFKEFTNMKTLYVSRPLINGDDLIKWAKEFGFEETYPATKMHVTLAFSKDKVDWSKIKAETNTITVVGGPRELETFDKGATVQRFASPELKKRWEELKSLGASWDYPDYKSHVTITYEAPAELDIDVPGYTGKLIFGPEKITEVDEDWKEKVKEK